MAVEKILDQKVGKLSLVDGFLIAGSKIGSEMVLSKIPFVGNSSIRSGLIKTGVAVGLSMVTGNSRSLSYVYTGMLIDGMEDLVLGAKRMFLGGSTNSNGGQEVVVIGA